MPTNEFNKIIAIDPGTGETGFAVMDYWSLLSYGVKALKRWYGPQKRIREVRHFINRLVDEEKPQVVLIEKPFFTQQKRTALLLAIVEEIKAVAEARRLKIFEYSPVVVREFLCKNGRATKRQVAEIIVAEHYPELARYLNHQSTWQEKYWSHVFDSVALGIVYFRNNSL